MVGHISVTTHLYSPVNSGVFEERNENCLKTFYCHCSWVYWGMSMSNICPVSIFVLESISLAHTPPVSSPQAASLSMSIIIVGVGSAEFDGKCMPAWVHVCSNSGDGGNISYSTAKPNLFILNSTNMHEQSRCNYSDPSIFKGPQETLSIPEQSLIFCFQTCF